MRSEPVDGFSLAYERRGGGHPVLLLHGWPGDHGDWREVAALLSERGDADLVIPDLRGFGASDKHPADPSRAYSAAGQADSLLSLLAELRLQRPVIAGYDIGSRVAQRIARAAPDRVAGLVIAPPVPGVGRRILDEDPMREFWYQAFHRLSLPEEIVDGDVAAVRAYLAHFWEHWSGPGFSPRASELDRLAALYGAPGAFTASIGWYRAGSGTVASALSESEPAAEDRIGVPTTILWPAHDPLFPPQWGDRIDAFFADAELRRLPGSGHFAPLEAPRDFAAAIVEHLDRLR